MQLAWENLEVARNIYTTHQSTHASELASQSLWLERLESIGKTELSLWAWTRQHDNLACLPKLTKYTSRVRLSNNALRGIYSPLTNSYSLSLPCRCPYASGRPRHRAGELWGRFSRSQEGAGIAHTSAQGKSTPHLPSNVWKTIHYRAISLLSTFDHSILGHTKLQQLLPCFADKWALLHQVPIPGLTLSRGQPLSFSMENNLSQASLHHRRTIAGWPSCTSRLGSHSNSWISQRML